MFTTTGLGLFKTVPCPADDKCKLVNCIFSHEPKTKISKIPPLQSLSGVNVIPEPDRDATSKRRKLDGVSQRPFKIPEDQGQPSSRLSLTSRSPVRLSRVASKPLVTTVKTVSPPPTRTGSSKPQQTTKPAEKPAVLTPRAVAKTSAPYTSRLQLLKALHGEIFRLNAEAMSSKDEEILSLKLSPNDLIKMAVDEEEEVATKQSAVYANVMKNKCLRYRKMKLSEWTLIRKEMVAKNQATEGRTPEVRNRTESSNHNIEAGLSEEEELVLLERFVLRPDQLNEAGFIMESPTDAQLKEAEKLVQASGGYETCDRCSSRFQMFNEKQENGTFASGGQCTYHWARLSRPPRDKDTGTRPDAFHACCLQPPGSTGCTTAESHVFKIHELNASRLATILQFEHTPENDTVERIAVVFDCEMAYTTYGMEVVRLSALKWPSNKPLVDVLVQPIGHLIDLNTKWSGVTPQQWQKALDDSTKDGHRFNKVSNGSSSSDLRLVDSPAAARQLLTSHISANTVLIGHALNNDLNVLRMIHPTIVDTSLLFPHHAGLPIRHGLRKLAKDFLNMTIQSQNDAKPADSANTTSAERKSETEGHDSMEDSRATGDLVRWKIAREWALFKDKRWMAKDGKFFAEIGGKMEEATLPPYTEPQAMIKKRKAPDRYKRGGIYKIAPDLSSDTPAYAASASSTPGTETKAKDSNTT